MKLYNLFEEVILEGLITESVSRDQIINTINGEYTSNGKKFIRRIRIHYDGDDVRDKFGNVTRKGKGWRNIVVHALGNLKNGGREAIRAYQVYGDSLRAPNDPQGWKLFRVDRISHWEPTNLKYWDFLDIPNQPTNETGDGAMSNVSAIVNFDPQGYDDNDQIDQNNQYIDPKANTYRYDNAEPSSDNQEMSSDSDETPTFDDGDNDNGVGFDDEKIRNVLDDESDVNNYEEEDIEDVEDEIENY